MDNLRYNLYKLILESDDENAAIDESLDFILTLKHTLFHNNNRLGVKPPHDVYPLSPRLSKELFNKNDPLDKQILELHRKKELDIKVVELERGGSVD